MKNLKTRRSILAGFVSAVSSLIISRAAQAAELTPRATEGPFYPTRSIRMADTDNDLVKVAGLIREAGGEVISLKGVIVNGEGVPLSGLRIEIWQCDVNGKYLHPGDDQAIAHDHGFQGFGHDITDASGSYSFRTIKPTSYPGRTPHIHVKILDGSRELLTSQFYIKGDSGNARDGLYRRMSPTQADAVSMEFIDGPDGVETTVNVVIP